LGCPCRAVFIIRSLRATDGGKLRRQRVAAGSRITLVGMPNVHAARRPITAPRTLHARLAAEV
jgi:hypothetical protein